MKKVIFLICVLLICNSTIAQDKNKNPRPSWNGYYNGYGITYGYSYNQRSGWNTIHTPNGRYMSYRDGYVPPRRYYNYNPWLNTYSANINQFVYPGMGW